MPHSTLRGYLTRWTLTLFALLVSVPVFAQTPNLSWFDWMIKGAAQVLNLLVPTLIALSFVVFVWGLILFLAKSDSEVAVQEGKRKMVWGVLVLFVIISIWGILGLLKTMTDTKVQGMGNVDTPGVPQQP